MQLESSFHWFFSIYFFYPLHWNLLLSQNKDLPETKFRVSSSTSHRGSRSDRGRGGSAQYSSNGKQMKICTNDWPILSSGNFITPCTHFIFCSPNYFLDSSAFQGKLAYKKENGKNSYTTSLSVPQVAVDNPNWCPSAFRLVLNSCLNLKWPSDFVLNNFVMYFSEFNFHLLLELFFVKVWMSPQFSNDQVCNFSDWKCCKNRWTRASTWKLGTISEFNWVLGRVLGELGSWNSTRILTKQPSTIDFRFLQPF